MLSCLAKLDERGDSSAHQDSQSTFGNCRSPGGTIGISPPIHRWVRGKNKTKVPSGTKGREPVCIHSSVASCIVFLQPRSGALLSHRIFSNAYGRTSVASPEKTR